MTFTANNNWQQKLHFPSITRIKLNEKAWMKFIREISSIRCKIKKDSSTTTTTTKNCFEINKNALQSITMVQRKWSIKSFSPLKKVNAHYIFFSFGLVCFFFIFIIIVIWVYDVSSDHIGISHYFFTSMVVYGWLFFFSFVEITASHIPLEYYNVDFS